MKATLRKRPVEIQQELTPSLETCVKHYLGEAVTFRLANPSYFFENTLIRGPLEEFLRGAFEGLETGGPKVLPLRIGFGFGKTHAQILLLHALLAPDMLPEGAENALRALGWNRRKARRALVLPLDFFDPAKPPFPRMARVVRAYADEGTGFYRGKGVTEKVQEHMDALLSGFLESDKFADIMADVALATESPVLVMVDEVGLGFVKRAERFLEAKKHGRPLEGDPLAEVHWLSAFLTTLAGKSEREHFPLVIIYAWAEQDEETLRHLAAEDERISNTLEIVKRGVVERLSRYTGGMEEGPLGLNPDDMLDIAIFRVLHFSEEEAERAAEQIANTAVAYGASTLAERGPLWRGIRRHYPLSPALARALKKLARRHELPGAEHVRSAIYLLSLVAERALHSDPFSPLLDVKHMTLEEASFLGYMGDLRQDWASLLSDLAEAINSAEPRVKALCEHISKLVLAKAATADIFDLERARDISRAPVYGATQQEVSCSLVCTTPAEKVGEAMGAVKEALDHLISRSGRIEERIINGERFYFPAVLGTVFGRLRIYLADEMKTAGEDRWGYLERSKLLTEIISNVKVEDCSIYRVDFDLLQEPEELKARVGTALNEPHPAFVLVEPWNASLIKGTSEQGGFVNLASCIVSRMNELDYVDALGRPFYLVVLLPNIEGPRVEELIRPLVEYEAVTKFIDYLDREEDIRREMVEKALSSAAIKRVRLTKRDVERIIRDRVRQEIEAAGSATHAIRLRAAREAAVKFLKLLDHYIAYDPSRRAFSLQDLSKQISAAQREVNGVKDPSQCADAIGAFFSTIVSLRYVRDMESIEGAVQEAIREQVESKLFEPLSIGDLVESFVQGTYEVLPLSGGLLKDAIQRMVDIPFELPDKTVTVKIENDRISFVVEEKREPEEEPVKPPPPVVTPPIVPPEMPEVVGVAEFALKNLTREEMLSLGRLIKEGGINAQVVSVELRGEGVEGVLKFEGNFEHLTAAFNALSAIARNYGASSSTKVFLAEAIKKESLEGLLGDLVKKLA